MKNEIGCLLALVLFASSAGEVFATSGGPDSYGYRYQDNFPLGDFDYAWIDISSTGASVINSGNDASSVTSAPAGTGRPVELGFPFTFYGETVTRMVPAVDGYLSLNPLEDGADNSRDCPIPVRPSSGSGARIYVNHKNWQLSSCGRFQTRNREETNDQIPSFLCCHRL